MNSMTEGELEVIQVLWENGPLKPAAIQEKFPRPIKNATLRSALRVLLEKGHVTRTRIGKAYLYEARTPRETTFQKMTHRLAEIFAGGSPAGLIAQLIKTERLSEDDIRELRRLTEEKTARKARSPRGKKS